MNGALLFWLSRAPNMLAKLNNIKCTVSKQNMWSGLTFYKYCSGVEKTNVLKPIEFNW